MYVYIYYILYYIYQPSSTAGCIYKCYTIFAIIARYFNF